MDARKLILLILDGWGYREETDNNAIALSNPKNYNRLLSHYPNILLDASEEYVGLPKGQMGNSEVGHTNLGAGRVVYQDLLKITKAFEEGEVLKNKVFCDLVDTVKSKTGVVHLFGLISNGGVHSHIDHFKCVIAELKRQGLKNVFIHAVTDGRDTPPTSGITFLKELESYMNEIKFGSIADICGRFYAMDRDKRWDRVERGYNLLFLREGKRSPSVEKAMLDSYSANITDEFIEPVIIDSVDGSINDGDGFLFMNFRADRVREMLSAIVSPDFTFFTRKRSLKLVISTMTEYDRSIKVPVIFPPDGLENVLGEVLSKAGRNQLRIAETEKYAHVTYFFNGGREEPFSGEERVMVPSPRDVATYDLKPSMSIQEVTEKFSERFLSGDIDVTIMNFANPDMVGHTGVLNAAVEACKCVDEMIGKVIDVADKMDAVLLVTADHGNCEVMWDYANNEPATSHTTNPVKFILYNYDGRFNTQRGKLADVAPTILKIIGLPTPKEMTGNCLID